MSSNLDSVKPDITVFTCTYNRANTLVRTYQSLCDQTHKNFEWLVFDNGSTDNTNELIEQWKLEGKVNMKHMSWETNTGYQRTFNRGVAEAQGTFWIVLDSDDSCVDNAFERMLKIWDSIPSDRQSEFSGVSVNCVDQYGDLVGTEFPEDQFDSNNMEIRYKHKVKGDKFGMTRLEVLRKYPFTESTHHVNSGIVWRAIAKKYKIRYSNERLRTYYIDEVGREDQITKHYSIEAGAVGRIMNHKASLNEEMEWFFYAPLRFFNMAAVYVLCSMAIKKPILEIFSEIKPLTSKLLVLGAFPFAIVAHTFVRIGTSINKPQSQDA